MRRLLAFALFIPLLAGAAGVRQFLPQGQIDQQTRATAIFTDDMVPLGQPDAAAPFNVNCGTLKGKGRWSDARTWSYLLDRALQAGERCDFVLKPGLKSANGEAVSGQDSFAFFAPGPWPRSITPRAGGNIEEDQGFLVELNGPVRRDSVEKNVWCEADGVGQRIPIRILPDTTRNAMLASVHRNAQAITLALTCTERLPAGSKVRLVWGKGVTAENGTISSREESFRYSVRAPFRAAFSCDRERANAPCSPLSDLRLEFSAPIDAKLGMQVRLITPEGNRAPEPRNREEEQESTLTQVVFKRPLPQNAEFSIEIPRGIQDEAGRALENASSFPLKLRTGALPPLAKFAGDFGIVELKEGGILPVTLRNVEAKLPVSNQRLPGGHQLNSQRLSDDAEVIAAIKTLAKFEQQTRQVKLKLDGEVREYTDIYAAREQSFLKGRGGVERRELPKPGGSAEFEVVGIPLGKPGFHIVEIESQMLGAALLASPRPMYVRTTALNTNLAVHFKRGKDNALVWVTTLDTGKPVPGAEVRVSNCDGRELWRGRTDEQGRALAEQALPEANCKDAHFLFISARLGEDYSFARSDWNEGIESWRFGVETWGEGGSRRLHTILDRTLLRPGQTVSMKHIVRGRQSRGFAYPDAASLPTHLFIRHHGSNDEFRLPLTWDARGTALSQWKIPDSAKRGAYSIILSGAKEGEEETGGFRISDFRLPVFTGSVQGVPSRQIGPKEVPLALGLSFLNGGAAKGANVQVSATLRPRWPEYKGFDRFAFNVDFEQEGLAAFAVDNGRESEQLVADKLPVTLDKAGAGKLAVKLPERVKGPSELYSEMTFADPNGEIQTIRGSVELWPAGVVVGIRVKDWLTPKAKGSVEVVALDPQGKPLADVPVKVIAKRRIDYSHRKRIVGGFYAYEHNTEFKNLGEICSGTTDSRGMLLCSPQVDDPGAVYLLAEARDKDGNTARAGTSYWVSGHGDNWFAVGNQDRIDVIPEKRSYNPGETARLQVRTPFREATALVAIEAEGIIETRVVPLSRFKPIIELPVNAEWGPNVFVSVLAVRGRIQPLKWTSFFDWGWREPLSWFKEWWNPEQPTAMVDLAKPAFKLGLASLDVGTDGFRLKVDVKPEKADYRPRDKASVRLTVIGPDGKPVPAGTEVAFAAVDQALLELRPNDTWNLLEAMLQKRAYQIETATAQSQVVGKRHFGKKAVAPGGGGGRAPARELFDTLLVWNPKVALDANGSAVVQVPINDSLTEFKLVAIADAGTGFFGTGSASIRTKQDLQLISGLPPLVREKDKFTALLTLRNGTAKPMSVTLAAKAGETALPAKEIRLEAEGAAEVRFEAEAKEGISSLTWEFDANDKDSSARDKLKITQQVAPAVPVTVQQASFARVDKALEIPAQQPTGSLPGRGGIEIGLSPKISTPPPGLRRYFEQYPFICLEQKTSVAIGLNDKARWQTVADALPTYLDQSGLAAYFPGNPGSPALTAYVLSATHAAGFSIEPEVAARMERALNAFAEGRIKPEHWAPVNDLVARKLTALEALTRRGGKPLSAISSLEIDPPRMPTSALIDWMLVLQRMPELPDRNGRLAAVDRELRNRLNYLGGKLTFTSERSDYWWWLMASGDSNTFRLIEAVLDQPGWQADLPALVQGAMQRQVQGRWSTTVANVWARIALDKFGAKFEKETVAGTTRASLGGGAAQEFAWKNAQEGEAPRLMLPWPAKPTPADKLQISQEGSGKPWAAIQVLAAQPVTAPRAMGFRISRSVTPVQEKEAGKPSRGDVWRVQLAIESDQEMAWVVVDDPIPAGARILGEGDGRDSHIAANVAGGGDRARGNAWPAYIERTFGNFRAYYSYVPRGKFTIEYTVRLNNGGEFSLPATRVEAMYAPEVFGELPNGKLSIRD